MADGRIGVVTVTYNSEVVLPDFLRCLWAQTHADFLLFAVDNASTDKTVALLGASGDARLKVVANEDNRGVAEGNNQGIRGALEAGCSQILLLNNDTEFGELLLENLADGLVAHHCDMVCPKMLYFDEPKRIWAAGGYFQPKLGYRCLHYGQDAEDRGQFDRARLVTYAPTCCVLIRSDLFANIGLMDARYFVYVDDTDFMYRALRAGATLYYLPYVEMFHKVGSLTGGNESNFTIRYGVRNRSFFALKHFGLLPGSFWVFFRWTYYLSKLLLRRDDLATFRLRHKSVREAYSMFAKH